MLGDLSCETSEARSCRARVVFENKGTRRDGRRGARFTGRPRRRRDEVLDSVGAPAHMSAGRAGSSGGSAPRRNRPVPRVVGTPAGRHPRRRRRRRRRVQRLLTAPVSRYMTRDCGRAAATTVADADVVGFGGRFIRLLSLRRRRRRME